MEESSRKREGEAGVSAPEATGFHGIEETSPYMLKNTSSNIMRLADEIRQCEGRQKYLTQTRSPSDGGDVRWYFRKVPLADNELAASVPSTEIVGKGNYFRFGMRDSLAIEASFLQREEELLSCWWKEYAECSEGPKARPSSDAKVSPKSKASSLMRKQSLYALEEERVGVPVKGGLYEVDLVKRHCFPVYWNGENRRVLRGHWFARKWGLNWLPLREDVSEQLEFAYRSKTGVAHGHGMRLTEHGLASEVISAFRTFAARVDLQGSTQGLHALFTGEDDTWEAWLNIDASGFSAVISFGGNGIMLRRGYATSHSSKPTQDELCQLKEEEMDDYCSRVPVQHLVFMVHGIGQRLENSNLVDDVTNFRIITEKLAERHLTSYQRETQRVLFIPCQWRKGLKLSGEVAIEKITLDGMRGLRMTLSATVLDVLYYMSPIYCQDIINSVSDQLNRLYLKFLKRNPGYDGKVSLFGHSLGSVLSYDIICHQENLSSPFPMEWMYKEQHPMNEESSSPTLNNQSSEYNSKSSQNNYVVSINNQTKGIVGPSEDGNAGGKTTFPVPEMEDSSVSAGFSVPLAFDEPSAMEVESKQPDAISSLGKDDNEKVSDSRDMLSCKTEYFNDASNVNNQVPAGDVENLSCCGPENDKDKAIELLGEEIDCLKARIAELETVCSGTGVEVVSMTTANQPVSGKLPCGQNDTLNCHTPYIKYTKLEFTVDTFFAVGSPLGVFLALRNTCIGIGKGQEYWEEENVSEEMPACRQMFNIFHPFDPVAYRLEPLIGKEYISKRPVIIPYHRGGKRLHIRLQEFAEDFALRSQEIMDQLGSVRVKLLTLCQSRDKDNLDEASEDNLDKLERSYGSIMMERLTGSEDGRVDHMLQHKTFQLPYISVIGSHTNYWRDDDTALFILKHLYRDIPKEPELLAGKNLAAKRMITGQKVGQTKERLRRKNFL